MKLKRLIAITAVLIISVLTVYTQEIENSLFMDFRNQKITDILYSIADICGKGVFIDETVTGNTTFHFEDKDFDSALDRFARHCQLFIEKDKDAYFISKVSIAADDKMLLDVTTENVSIEPFLNILSRKTERTILYDALPNATVTIRAKGASLEDILNFVIVKLPGFGLERIADGFYITKSVGNINKRNIDIFTVSNVDGHFSVSIQKASFSNVMETIFKKAGKEYSLLAKQGIQLENLTYTDKDFDSLLTLILEQASCDYSTKDGIYYIYEIQKKDVMKKFKETKILELKNISAEAITTLLPQELNGSSFVKIDKNSNTVILTGSPTEITPIEDFIKRIDVPATNRHYKSFVLNNISAKDAAPLIPKSMLSSDLIPLPAGEGFVTQVTDESENELKKFISVIDSNNSNRAIRLKYIKSEELVKALPPSINKENVTETADPTMVFFSGTENNFKEFSDCLKVIDCPKQQIRYQLLVLQRQKTQGLNWGASLTANNTDADPGYSWSGKLSNIFGINFDIISKFGVQFAGSLNAELGEGKSHVLADTTLNGISGEAVTFSNTNTYRYRDIIANATGDLYTSTTREISSGLVLSINGWVSGDGMVTVKIDAQVSKQGTAETGTNQTDTTNPPPTSEKKVSTNVRTKSGEPVIIGGLFQQEEDITEKRTPFLGSIPLLGYLFKKKTVSMADTEFIIYLVPFVEKKAEEMLTEEQNLIRLIEKYKETEAPQS